VAFVEGGSAKITVGMLNIMLACLVQESLNFQGKPAEKNLVLSACNDPLLEKNFYAIK
jgi:hypothetical protein